ncbi:MAG: YcaO-like family protein [Halobacteriaceae archaeon]
MTVVVVGDDPASAAVVAAVRDAGVSVERGDLSAIADASLGVVVGVAGGDGFGRTAETARAGETPWIAVEVGGIGGRPVADLGAAVTALSPSGPCFTCLRRRVEAADPPAADSASAGAADVRFAGAVAGRMAVRLRTGEDTPGTCLEVPHAERSVLPVPGCPACGGDRFAPQDLEAGGRSLDDAASAADRAVDGRVGPVTAVGERESFPAPYYLATLADTSGFSDAAVGDQAAGVADGWDRAYLKAVGEALERYAAAVYDADAFDREASAARADAVSPDAFVRPDGFDGAGPEEPVAWLSGRRLGDGTPVSLPAAAVVHPPPEDDRAVRPPITTGLALGNSPVEACLAGACEVIERDATMLAWYSTFEPLGLTVDDEDFAALRRRARAEGLTVTALLVTQDVDLPVVTVAVHREEWPRFAVGSAADLDAAAAARNALSEAVQNWMELRAMGPDRVADAGGEIARYADFPREVRDLVEPDTTVPLADVGPDEPPTGRDALDAVVDRAADADLPLYAATLTTRDLRELGFAAVRVLSPPAQPLFVEDPAFGERARTVPRELGFRPRLDRPFHPYP